jgi:hypothetical protein
MTSVGSSTASAVGSITSASEYSGDSGGATLPKSWRFRHGSKMDNMMCLVVPRTLKILGRCQCAFVESGSGTLGTKEREIQLNWVSPTRSSRDKVFAIP